MLLTEQPLAARTCPDITSGAWRIESRAAPVTLPGPLGWIARRRRAMHYYLALVGPDGGVAMELHGGLNVPLEETTAAPPRPRRRPSLRVLPVAPGAYIGCPVGDRGTARTVLSGPAPEIMDSWRRLVAAGRTMTERGISYGLVLDNSNSAWATLLSSIDVDPRRARPRHDGWAPGWNQPPGRPAAPVWTEAMHRVWRRGPRRDA